MVKREKTPDPGDEEPRYYAVVGPYPLHPNWDLESNRDAISFSRWIAVCLGKDSPLYGILHKPSSHNTVLVEIQRDLDRSLVHESFLGKHLWSEVLVKPRPEDKQHFTRVYYSTYSSERAAQKDGWKRIHVEADFFKDWSVENNGVFKHPYPKPSWCDLPKEDPTNKPICRFIPLKDEESGPAAPKTKLPPPPPPRVVPGAPGWEQSKASFSQPRGRGKGARGKAQQFGRVPQPPPTKSNASTNRAPFSTFGGPSLPQSIANLKLSNTPDADIGWEADSTDLNDEYIAPWEPVADTTPAPSFIPKPVEASKKQVPETLEITVKCPIHEGKQCKKGICQAYKQALRQATREAEELAKKKAKAMKNAEKRKRKKEEKKKASKDGKKEGKQQEDDSDDKSIEDDTLTESSISVHPEDGRDAPIGSDDDDSDGTYDAGADPWA